MVSATLDLRLPSQRRASLPFDQYLVILLCDDRDTYVRKTCPRLLPESGRASPKPATFESRVERPNYYTTGPHIMIRLGSKLNHISPDPAWSASPLWIRHFLYGIRHLISEIRQPHRGSITCFEIRKKINRLRRQSRPT